MSTRSYADAIQHLNTLQSNAATIEAARASGGRLTQFAIPEMIEYLGRIGYSPSNLDKLNVIHITGTKGKGSTSAFVASIIQGLRPDWKIGLYTSPHLVAVRERIRINGLPVSEDVFAKYFFEVWDRLEANTTRANPDTPARPAYFRFITLLAFHIFTELKVDATVLEVGVGGRFDSTNIVPKPVVTGITALGLDHTAILGKTLADIAWQKSGIFKEGVAAYTVDQPAEALDVLREQATELKASEFNVIQSIPGLSEVRLGLSGAHQYQNATLAVALARAFISAQTSDSGSEVLSEPIITALSTTRWPGRCQTVSDPRYSDTTWFLDGAHTVESLTCCMEWYVTPEVALRPRTRPRPSRVLIFNCTNGRSGHSFLGIILAQATAQLAIHGRTHAASELFDHVIFCTNVTYASGNFKGDLSTAAISESDLAALKTQHELASAWASLVPSFDPEKIHVLPSVEHAVDVVRGLRSASGDVDVDVLVAGSLHLVGGVVEVAGLAEVAL